MLIQIHSPSKWSPRAKAIFFPSVRLRPPPPKKKADCSPDSIEVPKIRLFCSKIRGNDLKGKYGNKKVLKVLNKCKIYHIFP